MRANGDITLCQYIDKYICNAKNNNYLQIADKEYDSISKKLLDGELFPICMHCCHLRFKNSKNEKGKNKKI